MDNKEKWTAEISRSAQSVRDSQFVTEKGFIAEKALEIFHIPRSVQDIDVITLADEYNCALEATVTLFLMANRDGEPRTGANLYSLGIGLLSWDINWTASTKLKIWRLHQALKVGCKDDLDFVIKIACCFLKAEKNNVAESWAKYFQINYQVMQEALADAQDILASHYRMNAMEGERSMDVNIIGRMRQVFNLTWQNRIAKITGDEPTPCLKAGKGEIAAISPHCICRQQKGKEVIIAAAADGVAIFGGYPQQMPVSSFIVCLAEKSQKEKRSDFFIDQILPIGSLINVTEKRKEILISNAVELPPAINFYYRKTLNGNGSPKKEMFSVPAEFAEEFICSEFKEEAFEITGNWIGKDTSDQAIVIGWTEKSGYPVAILAPVKDTEVSPRFKVGDTLKATIQKVVRDPSGKGGFVLASLNYNPCAPIEINAISLSPAGYGLEKIEGQTLNLFIVGFDEEGNPLLSNIDNLTEDLMALRKEISESDRATKDSERSYIELSALTIEIDEEEEKAIALVIRGKGIIHPLEVSQSYVAGGDFKNLRINEEVIARLFNRVGNDEISVEYFTERELKSILRNWKLNEAGDKVALPLCLKDKDLKGWDARPGLIDFVKRHSWQYCIGARIELKEINIQQKVEAITRWKGNIENSEDYIANLYEQIEKLEYGIANARTVEYAAERMVWLAQKRNKIEEVENQIQEWREKISSVLKELKKIK